VPRKTGKIQSNKTILLVVEGATEQIYFSEMKSFDRIPGVTIIPRLSKHSSLFSILTMAVAGAESYVYDSVWCVFDCDTIVCNGITEAVSDLMQTAERKGIHFADSLPAFEIWYLLHYTMPEQFYQNQNVLIKELQKYIQGYEKTERWLLQAKLYSKLKPLQEEAKKNSFLLTRKNEKLTDKDKSVCNVYKIFLEIEEMQRK